jgi:hypothetical protein
LEFYTIEFIVEIIMEDKTHFKTKVILLISLSNFHLVSIAETENETGIFHTIISNFKINNLLEKMISLFNDDMTVKQRKEKVLERNENGHCLC